MSNPHGAREYELVSSHSVVQRGRSRGCIAAVSLAAGVLAILAIGLTIGPSRDENGGASHSLMRVRDSLLGGQKLWEGPLQKSPDSRSSFGGYKMWEPEMLKSPVHPPAPKEMATVNPLAPKKALAQRTNLATIHNLGATMHNLQLASPTLEKARVQSLDEAPPRIILDISKQPKEVQAFINSGHMICCVRVGEDLSKEVYPKFYDDFPLDPQCIPGYRKDTSTKECLACDADHYCPARMDVIFHCPPETSAPPGSGEITECWCQQGYYGKNPKYDRGVFLTADCQPCTVDKFCPGAIFLVLVSAN